jgi:hypothetical protein
LATILPLLRRRQRFRLRQWLTKGAVAPPPVVGGQLPSGSVVQVAAPVEEAVFGEATKGHKVAEAVLPGGLEEGFPVALHLSKAAAGYLPPVAQTAAAGVIALLASLSQQLLLLPSVGAQNAPGQLLLPLQFPPFPGRTPQSWRFQHPKAALQ